MEWEVKNRIGFFHIGRDASEDQWKDKIEKSLLKFMAHEETLGWEAVDPPHGSKVTIVDEDEFGPNSFVGSGMYVPENLTHDYLLPSNHPIVLDSPDDDIYFVWCKMKRPAQTVNLDVDDRLLEEWTFKNPTLARKLGV